MEDFGLVETLEGLAFFRIKARPPAHASFAHKFVTEAKPLAPIRQALSDE